MNLKPGDRITPYEIVGLLGAGGMGEVYRARDARLGRDVAIKVLPAGFAGDPERLGRFEQEARAAAALNHPNILAIHDIGQHDGAPYIVTELLEGETLRERLAGGALPVRKAIEYAVQVAKGLAAAHDKGIVHRDLKPENVFVTADDRVKILDFGLAKLIQPEPAIAAATALPTTPQHTLTGMVLGTIGYMAPEQVRGLPADHRADIFAFGAILYELLSGQRAFRGETSIDTMTAILKEDPPTPSVVERHIPPALERIVARCLEKTPAARFKSADDLAFALESFSTHSGTASAVTGRVNAVRREHVAWLAAAVGLIAALALAVAYVRGTARTTAAPEMRLQIVTPPNAVSTAFALSPDGTMLAFLAGGQLWLRPLASETARALPGTEGAAGGARIPFWSPDSRSVGFFTPSQLKRIEIDTGLVQALADAPNAIGGSWSSEGIILFAPSTSSPIMRIGAGGRGLAEATHLQAPRQVGHRFPQFLPDGRRFLFVVQGASESRGVYVGSLDSAETRRLLEGDAQAVFAPPSSLLFTRQGALLAQPLDLETVELAGDPVPLAARVTIAPGAFNALAASASTAGPMAYRAHAGAVQLLWADRAGRQIGLVGQPDAAQPSIGTGRLSPDGRTLAVTRTVNGNTDVSLLDLERSLLRPFTFEATRDGNAIWSPDGRRMAFTSERTGVHDLYEKPTDGSGTETLVLASSDAKSTDDWSRDGRFMLYTVQDPKTDRDLWVLPLTGDRKPFVVAHTQFSETSAGFSPDGRWIAYQSDETGRNEVFVQPFPGSGGKIQISAAGGTIPQWRRDGRELFYLGSGNRVMAVPVAVSGSTLKTGTPVALFTTPGPGGFIASADGQRFLVSMVAEDAAPITLLLNWAGLRR